MNENSYNELQLVDRAVLGDRDAMEELIRHNQDFIYNSICYMIRDRDRAEDLAQSVFLRALENIRGFRKKAKFSTWLYSIMVNTVRSYWRETGRKSCVSLDHNPNGRHWPEPQGIETGERDPFEELVSRENVELIRTSIAALPEAFREIIVLRDIEGLSYDRLSGVLNIPVGTVKSRLARARNELKKKLEQISGEI